MNNRARIDLHHFLERCSVQGHQCRHDFCEAGGRKPAGGVFFKQHPPGFQFDHIQGGSLDDRPILRTWEVPPASAGATQGKNIAAIRNVATNSDLPCSRLSILSFAYRPNKPFMKLPAFSRSDGSSAGGSGSVATGGFSWGMVAPGWCTVGLFLELGRSIGG